MFVPGLRQLWPNPENHIHQQLKSMPPHSVDRNSSIPKAVQIVLTSLYTQRCKLRCKGTMVTTISMHNLHSPREGWKWLEMLVILRLPQLCTRVKAATSNWFCIGLCLKTSCRSSDNVCSLSLAGSRQVLMVWLAGEVVFVRVVIWIYDFVTVSPFVTKASRKWRHWLRWPGLGSWHRRQPEG